MNPVAIIEKKRDGHALTREEIEFFVLGYTRDQIPDYQAAAWCMAVYLRGMDDRETRDLTEVMARSGEVLDLSGIAARVVDKHSSGGVGDKTTLAVAPVVAAAGLPVGKMSGRGLSFTGGTLDKLESIPGYRVDLSKEEFLDQLRRVGLVVAGQSAHLAPADGKLYSLRDVTGTVPSLPLIASSIMSKKIAAGAQAIVLDVKVGAGAFMPTEDRAAALAETMVRIGAGLGREVAAVLSGMEQPLGRAVGNSVEVREALATLRGEGPPDFVEQVRAVAGEMLRLGGEAAGREEGRQRAGELLQGGQALEKFGQWIEAQGGDRRAVDDPGRLPWAPLERVVETSEEGWVAGLNAREVGLAVVDLGGGRKCKDEAIDHGVGVLLQRKLGDRVEKGEPLFTLWARSEADFQAARERVLAAYAFSPERIEPPPLIKRVIAAG